MSHDANEILGYDFLPPRFLSRSRSIHPSIVRMPFSGSFFFSSPKVNRKLCATKFRNFKIGCVKVIMRCEWIEWNLKLAVYSARLRISEAPCTHFKSFNLLWWRLHLNINSAINFTCNTSTRIVRCVAVAAALCVVRFVYELGVCTSMGYMPAIIIYERLQIFISIWHTYSLSAHVKSMVWCDDDDAFRMANENWRKGQSDIVQSNNNNNNSV